MKRNLFFVFIALLLSLNLITCSKSGSSGTTANAQSNTQVDSGEILAQTQTENNSQAEIMKLANEMMAGKITSEEYQRQVMILMNGIDVMEQTVPNQNSSSNIPSQNSRVIAEKYRGEFVYEGEDSLFKFIFEVDYGVTATVYSGKSYLNEPFSAYTEGNKLIEGNASIGYEVGTFSDENTYVSSGLLWPGLIFKRK